MLLSGATIAQRMIVRDLRCAATQVQPCGVDLSLRRVLQWTATATATATAGVLDFDNSRRRAAGAPAALEFEAATGALALGPGAYVVEFNEGCAVPRDCMGQLFARSSLWRAGAALAAGVVDAGYAGALGALLDVRHPAGLVVYRDARLAQLVVHRMEREVDGYRGVYQGSVGCLGRDGPAAAAAAVTEGS